MLKKVKRRYLALALDYDGALDSKEFMATVWNAFLKLYGEYGASRTGLTLIDYDAEKRFAIIRTVHTAVEMARTALASISKIGNKPAAVHVLVVSGTLKALYKKIQG